MNNLGKGSAEKAIKPDENGRITEDTMAGLGATEPGQDPVWSRVFDPYLVTARLDLCSQQGSNAETHACWTNHPPTSHAHQRCKEADWTMRRRRSLWAFSMLAVKPGCLHMNSPARCLCARYRSAPRPVSSCFDVYR